MKNNYFGLKLKTGVTIFCEVIHADVDRQTYVIADPLVYDEKLSKSGDISVAFLPFAFYSKYNEHTIDASEVFMADPLNSKFTIMYGEALMGLEISDTKMSTHELLTGSMSHDYIHLMNMVDKCKKIAEKYSSKFNGIQTPDFSEMEQTILDNRPVVN